MSPNDNIVMFERLVNEAISIPASEKLVREIIKGIADNCPLPVLIELGRVVVSARKGELRDEAQQN